MGKVDDLNPGLRIFRAAALAEQLMTPNQFHEATLQYYIYTLRCLRIPQRPALDKGLNAVEQSHFLINGFTHIKEYPMEYVIRNTFPNLNFNVGAVVANVEKLDKPSKIYDYFIAKLDWLGERMDHLPKRIFIKSPRYQRCPFPADESIAMRAVAAFNNECEVAEILPVIYNGKKGFNFPIMLWCDRITTEGQSGLSVWDHPYGREIERGLLECDCEASLNAISIGPYANAITNAHLSLWTGSRHFLKEIAWRIDGITSYYSHWNMGAAEHQYKQLPNWHPRLVNDGTRPPVEHISGVWRPAFGYLNSHQMIKYGIPGVICLSILDQPGIYVSDDEEIIFPVGIDLHNVHWGSPMEDLVFLSMRFLKESQRRIHTPKILDAYFQVVALALPGNSPYRNIFYQLPKTVTQLYISNYRMALHYVIADYYKQFNAANTDDRIDFEVRKHARKSIIDQVASLLLEANNFAGLVELPDAKLDPRAIVVLQTIFSDLQVGYQMECRKFDVTLKVGDAFELAYCDASMFIFPDDSLGETLLQVIYNWARNMLQTTSSSDPRLAAILARINAVTPEPRDYSAFKSAINPSPELEALRPVPKRQGTTEKKYGYKHTWSELEFVHPNIMLGPEWYLDWRAMLGCTKTPSSMEDAVTKDTCTVEIPEREESPRHWKESMWNAVYDCRVSKLVEEHDKMPKREEFVLVPGLSPYFDSYSPPELDPKTDGDFLALCRLRILQQDAAGGVKAVMKALEYWEEQYAGMKGWEGLQKARAGQKDEYIDNRTLVQWMIRSRRSALAEEAKAAPLYTVRKEYLAHLAAERAAEARQAMAAKRPRPRTPPETPRASVIQPTRPISEAKQSFRPNAPPTRIESPPTEERLRGRKRSHPISPLALSDNSKKEPKLMRFEDLVKSKIAHFQALEAGPSTSSPLSDEIQFLGSNGSSHELPAFPAAMMTVPRKVNCAQSY